MSSSPCLSEERVAELVEGRLTGDALKEAEEHLGTCSDCRAAVRDTAHALGDAAASEPVPTSRAPMPAEVPVLGRGARVGRYVIDRLVGTGGMGRVYAAHDPALDRTVALKLLRPDMASADLESRLLREAKAMARMNHPHVIAVYDAGRHGEQVYIAMELIRGGTLREWVQASRRSWREILAVYVRAGQGLAEAHGAGMIHRDFKPDNVLVADDGNTVRVTDFGLARSASNASVSPDADTQHASEEPSARAPLLGLTRPGTMVGTPIYMAPEQHAGETTDVRADIYAYSVALYEALYGERPFWGETLAALHAAKLANQVRPPPEGKRIPTRLRRALLDGFRADPAERPRSMAALLDRLARVTRRRRGPIVLAAAALAAAGAALVYGAGVRGADRMSAASAVAAAAGRAEACSNRRCVEQHGGEPWVCRASDHTCVAIASAECSPHFENGDLEAEDTVWIGAMFPATGPLASFGQPNLRAVELARKEFAHATRALTGSMASLHVRRIAVVSCDDADAPKADAAAKHLVSDVGVPAIAGFRSGQEVMDLTGSLLIQSGVVSIATLTTSPLITQIPQSAELPRMVWRTTFSIAEVATAIAGFIHDYFEPRRRPTGRPSRVVLVRGDAPGAVAFGQTLMKSLFRNGTGSVEKEDSYREISLRAPSPGEERDQLGKIAEKVAAMAPSFVVLASPSTTSNAALASAIEKRWPLGAPRPTYFLAGDGLDSLADFLGASADRRARAFTVVSSSTSLANAHFVMRYGESYEDHVSRTENPGSSYDAFYLVAFATSTLPTGPVTGTSLARAFGRVLPPGLPIEVGPSDVFAGLAALGRGQSIDLEGASSPLDFDVATGEGGSDFALVCAEIDGSGRATGVGSESGLTLRAKTQRIEGTLRCR